MSKKNKNRPGYTRQGVRDLSYLKGKSVGIVLPAPPSAGMNCDHPSNTVRYDSMTGCTSCGKCKCMWDFDGHPI